MKTAILQTGHAPETLWETHGDYDDMSKILLGHDPAALPTYPVMDGALPASPDDYDLYLITGSPSGVYDGDPWIADLEDFVCGAFAAQRKMIGICFGHQLMAQAMGASVAKSDKGYGLGMMDYEQDSGIAVSLPAWHQDQVLSVPDSAEVILSSEFCPIAGLKYGELGISFQPHPEFTRSFVEDLINYREGGTITSDEAAKARRSMSRKTDRPIIQNLLAEFMAG